MGVLVRSVAFAAASPTDGIQRVSLPASFETTPVAFRLLVFGTTTDGSVTTSVRFTEGWYDGTSNWCAGGRSLDTTGASDCDSYARTDGARVGAVITTGDQTLDDYCDFEAWGVAVGVGYVDIKWNGGAPPGSAWRCILTAWTGTDLTVEVGSFTTSGGTVDTAQTITVSTGLTANALRLLGSGASLATGDNYAVGFRFGGGWGVSDGAATPTIQQYAHGWFYSASSLNPWAGQIMESSEEAGGTARCYAQGDDSTTGTGLMELELADVDSGSFKVTPRGTHETKTVGYVVFDTGGVIDLGISYYEQIGSDDLGYDVTPDIPYTSVESAATFEPQHIDWAASDMGDTGYNRGNLSASMNPYGISDADDVAGIMGSFICESRGNDAHCWTYFDSAEFIHVIQEDGSTLRWSADGTTIISSGITLTIGTIPASTTKVNCSIAWGVTPSGGGSGWTAAHVRRQTNQLRRM